MKKTIIILSGFFLVLLGISAFKNTTSSDSTVIAASQKDGKVKELTKKTFDKFIKSGIVVVDFWATWCAPCRAQGPIVAKLSTEMKNVKFGKLDVDTAREIAQKYNIRSIPTIIIFKDGEPVKRIIGLHDKPTLKQMINAHLK